MNSFKYLDWILVTNKSIIRGKKNTVILLQFESEASSYSNFQMTAKYEHSTQNSEQ